MNKLILLIITLTLISCGTSHNYTKNDLKKQYYEGKTIYFKLNPNSKESINFSGLVGTIGRGIIQPNVEETFKLSIEELATETNLKLKYIESSEIVENNNILIMESDISQINWHFGLSVATLKTVVKFRNISNSKEINTIGIRKSGGGNEKNNLKKSLKDATYKFLKEFEKN